MRIIGIDYGKKRTGIAVSDTTQCVATPLKTVDTAELFLFLTDYFKKELVVKMVVGVPKDLKGQPTDATPYVVKFISQFKNRFPTVSVIEKDERFTSKMAVQAMIAGGTSKAYRQNKSNTDVLSAAIILQEYLDFKR